MQREIKFRGRAIESQDGVSVRGRWYKGNLIVNNGVPYIVGNIADVDEEYIALEYWIPVEPGSVGQYTSLKDKNGKEIYEGDIVDCHRWSDDNTGSDKPDWTEMVIVNDITSLPQQLFFGSHKGEREVIGNIYKNPNLIPN